jgi:hypothetical protein
MFDNEGNTPQGIDVTRAEYIALKAHPAGQRISGRNRADREVIPMLDFDLIE